MSCGPLFLGGGRAKLNLKHSNTICSCSSGFKFLMEMSCEGCDSNLDNQKPGNLVYPGPAILAQDLQRSPFPRRFRFYAHPFVCLGNSRRGADSSGRSCRFEPTRRRSRRRSTAAGGYGIAAWAARTNENHSPCRPLRGPVLGRRTEASA